MTAVKLTMDDNSTEKLDRTEKKKRRQSKEETDNNQNLVKAEKKKKKRKKDEKTARSSEVQEEQVGEETPAEKASNDDKEGRKRKRKEKKTEKEELLAKLPKVNEDGVAYTKSQIRRMMKRVKHGLTPIPTKEEAQEQSRLDALERKQEEQLYYGDGDESENEAQGGQKDDHEANDEGTTKDVPEDKEEEAIATTTTACTKKKPRRKKAVPDDYICSACQNKHEPNHWIYDCPDKVTVKGTNAVAKKLRGLHEPNANKVFLSGLPFEYKTRDLEALVRTHDCGKVVHAKLVTFPDTGRCKGQAYVTFESEKDAQDALKKLNGQIVVSSSDENKKKKKGSAQKQQKELRLKATKVLSRFVTKKKSK